MTLSEIERIVRLHKQAYGILLWLKETARNRPGILNEDESELFTSGENCAVWLKRHLNEFPAGLRPATGEFETLGHLVSSFFSTSFRVAQVQGRNTSQPALLLGAKSFRDRRHKKHSERRETKAAIELKHIALETLAREAGIALTFEVKDRALADAEMADDLNLWTYVSQLMRRAEFASQGSAVHHLWLELDEKTRKRFSAELIWKARERLENWLRAQGPEGAN